MRKAPQGSAHNPAKAVLLGVTSSTAYAFAHLMVRLVGDGRLHAFEIAFLRTVICFLAILAISRRLRKGGFRIRRRFSILARGALSAGGLLLWFYGLVHLPLAEAITLNMTTVCFASIGAALFLKEPLTGRKALGIALALGGALAIINPTFESFRLEYFAVIGAAACWGAAACIVRSTTRAEDPYTIVLWTTLIIAVFSFPPAVSVWHWPSRSDVVMLTSIGMLSAIGTLAWTNAFRHGEATLVTVTDFVQIAWGVLIGVIIGEYPTKSNLLGIVLIVVSLIVISFDAGKRHGESTN